MKKRKLEIKRAYFDGITDLADALVKAGVDRAVIAKTLADQNNDWELPKVFMRQTASLYQPING